VLQEEEAMKYPNTYGHRGARGGGSTRAEVNPYFIEDVALTPGEFARARNTDIGIVVPRQS